MFSLFCIRCSLISGWSDSNSIRTPISSDFDAWINYYNFLQIQVFLHLLKKELFNNKQLQEVITFDNRQLNFRSEYIFNDKTSHCNENYYYVKVHRNYTWQEYLTDEKTTICGDIQLFNC